MRMCSARNYSHGNGRNNGEVQKGRELFQIAAVNPGFDDLDLAWAVWMNATTRRSFFFLVVSFFFFPNCAFLGNIAHLLPMEVRECCWAGSLLCQNVITRGKKGQNTFISRSCDVLESAHLFFFFFFFFRKRWKTLPPSTPSHPTPPTLVIDLSCTSWNAGLACIVIIIAIKEWEREGEVGIISVCQQTWKRRADSDMLKALPKIAGKWKD